MRKINNYAFDRNNMGFSARLRSAQFAKDHLYMLRLDLKLEPDDLKIRKIQFLIKVMECNDSARLSFSENNMGALRISGVSEGAFKRIVESAKNEFADLAPTETKKMTYMGIRDFIRELEEKPLYEDIMR